MTKIIFISGIHGSGKTTLGNKISNILGLDFASSSGIIKKVSSQNWSKDKQLTNITSNQDALLIGINEFYATSKFLILDGHFTLLNNSNEITFIPGETFSQMNIEMVVACKLNVQIIQNRLYNRDDIIYDLEKLKFFQDAEMAQANKISDLLNIPITYFDGQSGKEEIIINLIKERILI